MSPKKCEHFDKGYCKNKNKCSLKHPLSECAGDCDDKRVCPKRHQIPCKNGQACAFFATESCEFLHHRLLHKQNNENDPELINSRVKNIEDRISELDVSSKDTNLADKVNNLEKENSEMKTLTKSLLDRVHDIDEEYSNKFDEFEKILRIKSKIWRQS